ncbi:copper-translocating P-type ATPase [bacterium]|nr:copper-translocating P-type ATPase [bacterium]
MSIGAAQAPPFGHPSTASDPAPFITAAGGLQRLELLITGARCAGCMRKIESAVGDLDGVSQARLNLTTGRLRVEWRGALTGRRIVSAVQDLGYGAAPYSEDEADIAQSQRERDLLLALGVAAFAAANIMLMAVPVWTRADISPETVDLLHWVSALVAFPLVLFAARPFFTSAIAGLRVRRINMDVPVSLAITLALGLSLFETIRGGEHTYFDACAALVFFLLIGRFLDARLRRRAWTAANALAAMQSATASRIDESGKVHPVRMRDVRPGDRLLLASGERLGVDAELVSDRAMVDLRLVTGETTPEDAQGGRLLHAGAVNLGDPVEVRAVARVEQSLMADVAAMLEAGEQRRSSYRRIADRAADIYIPLVHGAAALGFVGWLLAGASVAEAGFVAITVLIITCPCALALAAPAVQVVAAGRMFREGALLASGDALERLAAVDHVMLDKTGTLTLGDAVLDRTDAQSESVLQAAATLARASRHPLARAIASAAGPGPVATDARETRGGGVEGMVGSGLARLGSAAFVGAADDRSGGVWFRAAGGEPVRFEVRDALRPDAGAMVLALRELGCDVEIVSGDAEANVSRTAEEIGVDRWMSRASPRAKVDRLEALSSTGRRVLMVGDGLNDAGALSLAHASIAPGGAIDAARLAADCVVSGGSLAAVPRIIGFARAARARMRENFAFAALYNLVAVPVALAGLATPMVAAIAMSGSSLIVTLNALRLSRGGGWMRGVR